MAVLILAADVGAKAFYLLYDLAGLGDRAPASCPSARATARSGAWAPGCCSASSGSIIWLFVPAQARLALAPAPGAQGGRGRRGRPGRRAQGVAVARVRADPEPSGGDGLRVRSGVRCSMRARDAWSVSEARLLTDFPRHVSSIVVLRVSGRREGASVSRWVACVRARYGQRHTLRRALRRPRRTPRCGGRRRPSVVAGDISAMLWNGVIRTPRLSRKRCSASSSSVVVQRGARAAGARRVGREARARPAPRAATIDHGTPRSASTSRTPATKRSHSAIIPSNAVGGEDLAEGRARGGERQRVAGQRAADAADVDEVGVRRARRCARPTLGAHAVGADRDAAGDRLADRHEVGAQAPGGRAAARPGAERVRLVDDQQRAGAVAGRAQAVEEAGLGQDDADVGQRRLGQHAGDLLVGEQALDRRRGR